MSDTEGMIRLMRHAAETMNARIMVINSKAAVLSEDVRNVAAMAFACGVLEMVMASVAPPDRSNFESLSKAVRFKYDAWAEANDGMRMTDTELRSIERFLRYVLNQEDAEDA